MAIAIALVMVVGTAVALAATGGGSSSWGMMGGRYVYRPSKPTPVRTLADARTEAQKFASRLGLRVDEVLQFKRNFYAKLVDGKGNGATEVLVDPASGVVWTEYGPAMMWNTRYGMHRAGSGMMGGSGSRMMGGSGSVGGSGSGMMGGSGSGMMGGSGSGMMGGYSPGSPSSGNVSFSRARTLAQNWLNADRPGLKVETGGDAFPGYYTLETLKDGKITGMISVNARTGAVWFHTWHGAFIAKSE